MNLGKIAGKVRHRDKVSKGERLIYVVIFLWVAFGVLGILEGANITQLAGYYASLTLFVSTYLWGEWKRTSQTTKLFSKGENSSREVMIYLTVFLWSVLGVVGILFMKELNSLTVYFSSLSPFVISYIIYKTTKGKADLPIFDGTTQKLVDDAKGAADIKAMKEVRIEIKKDGVKENPNVEEEMNKIRKTDEQLAKDKINTEEPKDNDVIVDGIIPDDSGDVNV